MPSRFRPGARFRVEFDGATFAEDLEHTSSDNGRSLAESERDELIAPALRGPTSSAPNFKSSTSDASGRRRPAV
jgi:hypothetical protein